MQKQTQKQTYTYTDIMKKKLNQIICGVTDEIERWLTLFMSFSDKCPSIKKDFSSFSRKRYSEE